MLPTPMVPRFGFKKPFPLKRLAGKLFKGKSLQ
jgi:hypothetical protein